MNQPNYENQQLGDRRRFLAGLSVGFASIASSKLLPLARGQEIGTNPSVREFKGLITREREPVNLEFPFASLDGVKTPNNQFFVRTHFPIPQLGRDDWRLKCTGHVERELTLSYQDLRTLPSKTVIATIKCAGNSRVFLVPKAKGVLWELGAVSTAEWTGVSLGTLLDRAGVKNGGVEVILQGADKGQLTEEPKSPGEIHFARSLPLEKARQAEVLLAYQMNGKDLPAEHGFPLRAVVPGWYGMASVKWLTSIEVTDRPFQGYWQSRILVLESPFRRTSRGACEGNAGQIRNRAVLPVVKGSRRRLRYRVTGAAWSDTDIAKVEVSTDGGRSWEEATLLGDALPFTWRLWEFQWQPSKTTGKVTLMSRATDKKGRQQPKAHNPDKKAYLINHTLPIEVEIS